MRVYLVWIRWPSALSCLDLIYLITLYIHKYIFSFCIFCFLLSVFELYFLDVTFVIVLLCVKGKVKLSLCLTNEALHHEDIWGSGCIDPHFLDLGTSWRWVVSFMPLPLYSRERAPPYPFYRRLGGPQSRSGRYGKGKGKIKFSPLQALEALRVLRGWGSHIF
jgi:hypothetical protein